MFNGLGFTGDEFLDLSGNDNHGQCNATVTHLIDRADFPSATHKPITLDKTISLDNTRPMAICFSMRQDVSGLNGMVLGDSSSGGEYIWMRGGSYFRVHHGNQSLLYSDGVNDFTDFAHYCETRPSNSEGITYCDGELFDTDSTTLTGSFDIDVLGAGYSSGSFALVGEMGHVYLYERALTQREVQQIAFDPLLPFVKRRRTIAAVSAAPPVTGDFPFRYYYQQAG